MLIDSHIFTFRLNTCSTGIIRPHRSTMYVHVDVVEAYCYRWSIVICLSVCVRLSRSWALQSGWTDRDALWVSGLAVSSTLGFFKFQIFNGRRLKKAELRRLAKFDRNRSKRGRHMAIFQFFEMAAVRHLGFVICVFGPPTKGIWWSLSLCKIWLESMQ